jgi:predicted RNA binding protein YcfA (HicA-like mRNA interferase family)
VKPLSGKQFCRLLERHGWRLLRVHSSHHVYGKLGERAKISVPVQGNRLLKRGLQHRLMKLASIPEDDEKDARSGATGHGPARESSAPGHGSTLNGRRP